jgi:hypothetical protein
MQLTGKSNFLIQLGAQWQHPDTAIMRFDNPLPREAAGEILTGFTGFTRFRG